MFSLFSGVPDGYHATNGSGELAFIGVLTMVEEREGVSAGGVLAGGLDFAFGVHFGSIVHYLGRADGVCFR